MIHRLSRFDDAIRQRKINPQENGCKGAGYLAGLAYGCVQKTILSTRNFKTTFLTGKARGSS